MANDTALGRSGVGTADRTDIQIALGLAALTVILAWFFIRGTRVDWHVPLAYGGDSILHLMFIKRLIDGNGYFVNLATGFPFNSLLYDFPGSDGMSLIVLWAIGKTTNDIALTFNIYYLLGFPLATLSAYFVLRQLSASRISAAVFSLLFAFLPFHFLRLEHLYYTWYFVIPLFVWLGIGIATDKPRGLGSVPRHRWIAYALLLMVMASFGVYYAFFGAILLGLSGIYGLVIQRSSGPLLRAAAAGLFVTLGVLVNIAPNLWFFAQEGLNQEVAQRTAGETEIYGLKIAQLLLPRSDHRSARMATAARTYSSTFPNVNENSTATLGLLGSAGFLLLLYFSISPRHQGASEVTLQLGFLTIVMVLIATVGGFSSLFAFFITSLIRAWNRVSVFIAFMSLAAMALAFDSIFSRYRRLTAATAGVVLLFLGLWDQTTPASVRRLEAAERDYRSDRDFIAQIEAALPKGGAVYQLPYMTFPEAVPQQTLGSYALGTGYLHSNSLRWSFGVATGRPGDEFYTALARRPISVQVELAKHLGFDGLYIDRIGYQDHGAAIESELAKLIGSAPIVKADGGVAFYQLPRESATNSQALSPQAEQFVKAFGLTNENGKRRLTDASPFEIDFARSTSQQVRSISGMYGAEPWGAWSNGQSVKVTLKQNLPHKFTLELVARAFGPNAGVPVVVSVNGVERTFTPTVDPQKFTMEFSVPPKSDSIKLTVPRPISPKEMGSGEDDRAIGLGFGLLTIIPAPG